jgi:hypothetical protein
MIMPCMNATSAGERCGKLGLVDAGSVLLGWPGALGCTTTGGEGEPACWAEAAGKDAEAPAAMSKPNRVRAVLADWDLGLRERW